MARTSYVSHFAGGFATRRGLRGQHRMWVARGLRVETSSRKAFSAEIMERFPKKRESDCRLPPKPSEISRHHRSSRVPHPVRNRVQPAPLNATRSACRRNCLEGRDLALARSDEYPGRAPAFVARPRLKKLRIGTHFSQAGTRHAPGYGVCCPFCNQQSKAWRALTSPNRWTSRGWIPHA